MFSFGGNKSKGKTEASSFDIGANASSSFSDSLSRSVSGGQSSQSIAFEDLYASLYGGASGAAAKAAGAIPLLTGQAATLFSSGSRFMENLGGGEGREYLESRINGENPLVDQQIDALGADLGRFFSEQVNPEIALKGIAAGSLGGGRQGVAQGKAVESLAREFQQGALGIRTADMAARDAAARDLFALDTQAAATGIAGLDPLWSMAKEGAMAEFAPYQALASIFGGPTTLSESTQFAESDSVARSISESLGFSHGTSQSKSKSKSGGFSLGF